jgi:hypothetical protein
MPADELLAVMADQLLDAGNPAGTALRLALDHPLLRPIGIHVRRTDQHTLDWVVARFERRDLARALGAVFNGATDVEFWLLPPLIGTGPRVSPDWLPSAAIAPALIAARFLSARLRRALDGRKLSRRVASWVHRGDGLDPAMLEHRELASWLAAQVELRAPVRSELAAIGVLTPLSASDGLASAEPLVGQWLYPAEPDLAGLALRALGDRQLIVEETTAPRPAWGANGDRLAPVRPVMSLCSESAAPTAVVATPQLAQVPADRIRQVRAALRAAYRSYPAAIMADTVLGDVAAHRDDTTDLGLQEVIARRLGISLPSKLLTRLRKATVHDLAAWLEVLVP